MQRAIYQHLVSTNFNGIADKLKEARKNPNKRKFNRKNRK